MLVVFSKYKYCIYVKYFIKDITMLTCVIVIHIFDQFAT